MGEDSQIKNLPIARIFYLFTTGRPHLLQVKPRYIKSWNDFITRIFFKRMILSQKTLQLVIETKRRGIDVDTILEAILYPEEMG